MRLILMTTLPTITGLMPLMPFGGDFRYSMAVTIGFELGLDSVMTPGVMPMLYVLFFRVHLPAA